MTGWSTSEWEAGFGEPDCDFVDEYEKEKEEN